MIFCTDPAEMYYAELAKRVEYFKYQPKGVSTMCELMENLMRDIQDESIAQGRSQMATDMALDMLRDKKPIEEIIKYSRLSPEQVQKLAQQL